MYVQLSKYQGTTRVRIVEKYYEMKPDGIDESSGLAKQHRIQKLRLIRHIGTAHNHVERDVLLAAAKEQLAELLPQTNLFDTAWQQAICTDQLRVAGSYAYGLTKIVGACYDRLGLPVDTLLKPLTLARIVYPKSKRLTAEFLADNLQLYIGVSSIYRFMDSLDTKTLMESLLKAAQAQAKATAAQGITVIFYDVTTLYFETDNDDADVLDPETQAVKLAGLRKKGYSKDHRPDQPQVVVGLSVDTRGFPLGLKLYPGGTYEGGTLLDGVGEVAAKLGLKPADVTVVADAGMLSDQNLLDLETQGYRYIVGARIRSMTRQRTAAVVGWNYGQDKDKSKDKSPDKDKGQPYDQILEPGHGNCPSRRLIVTYSKKRATRSQWNRERLIASLVKKLERGVAVKKSKYIKLNLDDEKEKKKKKKLSGTIDMAKVAADARFDGLKGYITNTDLSIDDVINQYNELWHVERSFRMNKSDLKVRPVFHYNRQRIIGHIHICICALAVMKELEQQLQHIAEPDRPSVQEALRAIMDIRQYQLKAPGYRTTIYSELTQLEQRLLEL